MSLTEIDLFWYRNSSGRTVAHSTGEDDDCCAADLLSVALCCRCNLLLQLGHLAVHCRPRPVLATKKPNKSNLLSSSSVLRSAPHDNKFSFSKETGFIVKKILSIILLKSAMVALQLTRICVHVVLNSFLIFRSTSWMIINPLTGTLKPQNNGPLYSNTVIGTLAVDGWDVTARPWTVNVPTSYYLTWHYNCLCIIKG